MGKIRNGKNKKSVNDFHFFQFFVQNFILCNVRYGYRYRVVCETCVGAAWKGGWARLPPGKVSELGLTTSTLNPFLCGADLSLRHKSMLAVR